MLAEPDSAHSALVQLLCLPGQATIKGGQRWPGRPPFLLLPKKAGELPVTRVSGSPPLLCADLSNLATLGQ